MIKSLRLTRSNPGFLHFRFESTTPFESHFLPSDPVKYEKLNSSPPCVYLRLKFLGYL